MIRSKGRADDEQKACFEYPDNMYCGIVPHLIAEPELTFEQIMKELK